jgi:hypothetical protein
MIRHIPPCDDPACDSCWWDALDAEMYPAPYVEIAALRPGKPLKPITTLHLPGDADGH